jgi:hypothetical protein
VEISIEHFTPNPLISVIFSLVFNVTADLPSSSTIFLQGSKKSVHSTKTLERRKLPLAAKKIQN